MLHLWSSEGDVAQGSVVQIFFSDIVSDFLFSFSLSKEEFFLIALCNVLLYHMMCSMHIFVISALAGFFDVVLHGGGV